jgi:AcrR family transcriptional regulator
MPVRQKPTTDRRVGRTDALLRDALGDLIREKRYEDIVVKEILGRANVGRSTFYAHFADKDDLLASCIQEILRPGTGHRMVGSGAEAHPDLLWFSLPVLTHVERHRGTSSVGHERLHGALAEYLEGQLRASLRRRKAPRRASPELLARWIATTFVLVLDWWLESDTEVSAGEAHALFRGLVEPSLAAVLQG